MKIHQILFFCFLSALCGGHSGLVSANLRIYAGAEGGNGSISCFLPKSGSMKFFCKDECKAEDILIKTDEVRAQSGRYSTEYRDKSSGKGRLSVTITHLTKSDSGRYRCGFGGDLVPDSYSDFEVRVVDVTPTTSGPKWTLPPLSASLPSASTPLTTTQSVSSTSGSFTPSSVSPENTDQFTDYLLPLVISVVVFVAVVVTLVAVVLLLVYERKTNRNSDDMNMERVTFENRPPVPTREDSVYQSLDPATRDQDQIYETQHP